MVKKINLNRIISSNLACEMRLHKMKVDDVTKRIGIGRSAYYNKMQGRTPWTDADIERISKAFGVPVAALVTTREEVMNG